VGPAHQLERVANRRERVAQFVREGGEEFVLAAIGLAQDGFDLRAFGHVDADADAAADRAVPIVERLDVVLDVHDRAVGARDVDDVGHVRAMRHRILHRQLFDREIPPVALDAVGRILARRRRQGDIGVRGHAEQRARASLAEMYRHAGSCATAMATGARAIRLASARSRARNSSGVASAGGSNSVGKLDIGRARSSQGP
jgi:hypothetical protein